MDIGSRSIKLAQLERSGNSWRLVKELIQELPVGSPAQSVDRLGWLQSALKEFDAAALHVSLSGPEVTIRRVPMPLMSKAELAEAIKWQIKDQIPFPVHHAVLTTRVIGEVWDKDIKKQDVLVAAASPEAVHEVTTLIDRAGGRLSSLTPTQAALWRCVTALVPEASQGSVAVVEVGASESEVTIAKDGQIRLVRSLPVGGATVTESLVGVVAGEHGDLTIDPAKAEALTRRYGVLGEHAEGTTEEGVPLFQLASLMRPVLEHFLTELSRVLDFYKLQLDETGVTRVLLCGGGATIKQLQSYLADGLGQTVEIFNPLVRLGERVQSLEPEQIAEHGPRLGVAIGLAMDRGEGLNILPSPHRAVPVLALTVWGSVLKAVAGGALALCVGFGVVAGWLGLSIHAQQTAWKRLEPAYVNSRHVMETTNALEEAADRSQRFIDQQPVWDGAFKALAEATPDQVEFQRWTMRAEPDGWRFELKGQAAAAADRAGGVVAMLDALERSTFFSDVKLVSSEMRGGASGITQFTIEGRLE